LKRHFPSSLFDALYVAEMIARTSLDTNNSVSGNHVDEKVYVDDSS
jgi:hypothetical protein